MEIKPQQAKKATVEDAIAVCKEPVIEPKYDGWRIIAEIDRGGAVSLWSRTGKPYHQLCPGPILDELRQFPPGTILDGEIVDGTNNKNCVAVTNVLGKSKNRPSQEEMDKLQYLVFDCPKLDGENIGDLPLSTRRQLLDTYLCVMDLERVAMTTQAPADPAYHHLFVEMGFEGSMVKDLQSSYAEGKRGWGWFKIKDMVEIDVVVMSMELDGKGQHDGKVGKFVVGQYQDGELVPRARVNPYDDAMRQDMTAACTSPAGNIYTGSHGLGDPKVCTIKHYGRLRDGLRHPVFVRWREDKAPHECIYDDGE